MPVTAGGRRAAKLAEAEAHPAYAEWEAKLAEARMICPQWPEEFGGQGMDAVRGAVLNEEFYRAGVPRVTRGMGEWLVGPSVMVHGTPEQRAYFLPRIISGEDTYCQGFSEPGHGSDLAGVQTRGVVEGDELVITGQKVWTSGAGRANRMFLLCRTDPDAPKHAGLSYVLIDFTGPGVQYQPIKQMSGAAEFYEDFLDGVRTPLFFVIGGLNHGWRVAMTTLGHERGGRATVAHLGFEREFWQLTETARKRGKTADPLIRQQLAWAYTQVELMRFSGLRTLAQVAAGRPPGPEASVAKLFWSEYHKRLGEIAMTIEGADGLLRPDGDGYPVSAWQSVFLSSRAGTIYSGTSEIQRNIIGERALGLPEGAEPVMTEPGPAHHGAARELVTPERLRAFFAPRSIALVGASDNSGWARFIVASCATTGFPGPLTAVHPRATGAFGLPVVPSLRDLAEPAELAFILTPVQAVEGVLDDMGAAGIPNAVVLASGYREVGEAGRSLEDALLDRAVANGVTMLGPNCLGFVNAHSRSAPYALALPPPLIAGPVGVALQSGALASVVLAFAKAHAIGLSLLTSMGNEAMMKTADVLDYLVEDEATRVICLFLEEIGDPARFAQVAEKADRGGQADRRAEGRLEPGRPAGRAGAYRLGGRRRRGGRRGAAPAQRHPGHQPGGVADHRGGPRLQPLAARAADGRADPVRRLLRHHRRRGQRPGRGHPGLLGRDGGGDRRAAAAVRQRAQPAGRHRLRRAGQPVREEGPADHGGLRARHRGAGPEPGLRAVLRGDAARGPAAGRGRGRHAGDPGRLAGRDGWAPRRSRSSPSPPPA